MLRRYEFLQAFVPSGVAERSVACCRPVGQLLECWRNGVLLADPKGRTKGLVQLRLPSSSADEPVLKVEVRGACKLEGLWPLFTQLLGLVDAILADFPGLQLAAELCCPQCLVSGRWSSPRGAHAVVPCGGCWTRPATGCPCA